MWHILQKNVDKKHASTKIVINSTLKTNYYPPNKKENTVKRGYVLNLNILSDIGSGVIISEYSERFIRTFGNLKIKEENNL